MGQQEWVACAKNLVGRHSFIITGRKGVERPPLSSSLHEISCFPYQLQVGQGVFLVATWSSWDLSWHSGDEQKVVTYAKHKSFQVLVYCHFFLRLLFSCKQKGA